MVSCKKEPATGIGLQKISGFTAKVDRVLLLSGNQHLGPGTSLDYLVE
jgi:hypothetical protein